MKLVTQGRLARCILLSLRTPAQAVLPLVPERLSLLTYGPWAFWNVVISRIEGLRPWGIPARLGLDYEHTAYRLQVQARTDEGVEVEGLYFLRSDADSWTIGSVGDWCSDFRFHVSRIESSSRGGLEGHRVRTRHGEADLDLIARPGRPAPPDSCFDTPERAAAFLKYQPLGLCPDASGRWLRVARVIRDEGLWRERDLCLEMFRSTFFSRLGLPDPVLERATWVDPLDSRWELGHRILLG